MDLQTKIALVCVCISIVCKFVALKLRKTEQRKEQIQIHTNREQRRHPDGRTPATKFNYVNVTGRQKQGKGRAMRGW